MKPPKQRFLESPSAKPFADMAMTEPFVEALDAALLQMLSELPPMTDTAAITGNAFRVEGARRFIATLVSLPIVTQERRTTYNRDNLEP